MKVTAEVTGDEDFDLEGETFTADGSAKVFQTILQTNPSTGLPWAKSEIDNFEPGIEL